MEFSSSLSPLLGEDSSLQTTNLALRKHWICQHLDLRLPASRSRRSVCCWSHPVPPLHPSCCAVSWACTADQPGGLHWKPTTLSTVSVKTRTKQGMQHCGYLQSDCSLLCLGDPVLVQAPWMVVSSQCGVKASALRVSWLILFISSTPTTVCLLPTSLMQGRAG